MKETNSKINYLLNKRLLTLYVFVSPGSNSSVFIVAFPFVTVQPGFAVALSKVDERNKQ